MALSYSPPSNPHHPCCLSCGYELPQRPRSIDTAIPVSDARTQIAQLKAQVQLLNQKVSETTKKLAGYENEISRLRQSTNSSMPSPPPSATFFDNSFVTGAGLIPPPSPPPRSSFFRLSALLTRKSAPNLNAITRATLPLASAFQAPSEAKQTLRLDSMVRDSSSPTAVDVEPRPPSQEVINALNNAAELAAALAKEQSLRRKAERKFELASQEVEELSTILFEQANEMVATERQARAKLEERVTILEKRDADKSKRLDRLESALSRMRQARTVLSRTASP